MPAQHFLLVGAALAAAVAAALDLKTGHIPNWLTLGSLGTAIAIRLLFGGMRGAWSGVVAAAAVAVIGVVLCAALPLVLFWFSGMGGGDVKLLAAIGAALGPIAGFKAQLYAFVVLLFYACAMLAYSGHLLAMLRNTLALAVRPLTPKSRRSSLGPELTTSLRFGPAIFLGVAMVAMDQWGHVQ